MDREQQILAIIRENPFISQLEMSAQLGISRSAVAGCIAALTKRGVILGRAYITSEKQTVLCIGGANLDSKAIGKQKIRLASSNPVTVQQSCGGVARNIAENLANLTCSVSLLTVVGDDAEGRWVLEKTQKSGVDTSLAYRMPNEKTGAYTALLDESGEMFLAFANMDIYDLLTPAMIQDKWSHIAAAKIVVADTNCSPTTLDYLIQRCNEESLTLFIDPVSSEKSKRLPSRLDGVTAIFPNLEEACELASISVTEKPDYSRIADVIMQRGVKHVFITLGALGVWYQGEEGTHLFPPIPTEIVDVTGAGDAFVAGVVYGVLHHQTFIEACKLGLAAAHLTLQTAASVANQINTVLLDQTIKERLHS
ncbi:MAG: carbohydrate kinase [Paenibacillaceae bacterium]